MRLDRQRHASQLATVAVDLLPLYEAEAKKRQVASGRFSGKDSDGKPIIQVPPQMAEPENNPQSNDSRDIVAEIVRVASRYVSDAKLGLMLIDTERASAGRPPKEELISTHVEPINPKPPTLAELGIHKKVSTKSQKLAALP